MIELEEKIAKIHNRKYCTLVGNGTTAIYLSLLSQGFKNKRIAIPNNVCMNVVLPIYFSDNIPLFVDIEKETFGINIEHLNGENIDGIIGVHSYGNVCDIGYIENFCKDNNIFLIEDVAVAQGMYFESRPLGSFGDVSILSFGSGKNIDINHGGAILTDNMTIYDKVKENLSDLDMYSISNENKIGEISKKHTKLYNIDYGKNINKYANELNKLFLSSKNSFLYQFDNNLRDKLNKKIDKINSFIEMRKENSSYLKGRLENKAGVVIMESKYGSSHWRFNIFAENNRDDLFRYLLEKKYKVSSWYHSVDLIFEKREGVITPISDWAGENIINIWVNEDIDKKYLESISDDIIKFFKEIDNA
jgi:dTDP-4-amino-4,6-dideoxygalactose transaminase